MSKHLASITKIGLTYGKSFLLPKQIYVRKNFVVSISSCKFNEYSSNDSGCSNVNPTIPEVKDYNEFLQESKSSVHVGCKTLMQLLRINETTALHAVRMYPALQKLPCLEIIQNYETLSGIGIQYQSIKNNIWLLADTKEVIKVKARYIQLLPLELKHAIPFFNLKIKELRTLVTLMKMEDDEVPSISRIHYLSEQLQCPLTTMCNILMKHKYLLKISFRRLKNITEILIEHGVTTENILNDLWVFRYKENTVLMRVKKAVEAGVNPIKPWVVRCPESVLNDIFRRKMKRYRALEPYANVVDFLSAKLQCSKQDAEDFVDRNPAIYKMDPLKLKNVIEFLFEKEYKPEHLIQTPRLLYFGYKTILNRYNELELLKMKPSNLRVLCKSNAEVEDYIEKNKSMRIQEEQVQSTKDQDGVSN